MDLARSAALSAALLAVSCRSASIIGPNLDRPVVLRAGEVALFPGEGLRVGFILVDEDSRCPLDVVCVWEGVAKVAGWAEKVPRQRAEIVLSTSNSAGHSTHATYEGYSIELVSLSPRRAGATSQSDYSLTLVVRPK